MAAAIPIVQIITGFALILFGAWVTWRGIRIITQYYPQTIQPDEGHVAFSDSSKSTNLVGAMLALVNAEIASLGKPSGRESAFIDLGNGGHGSPGSEDKPQEGDEPSSEADPEKPDEPKPDTEQKPAPGAEEKASVLAGAAKIIEALPKLLNANFGPATVVCLVGLLIIAGGFYMLLQLQIGL